VRANKPFGLKEYQHVRRSSSLEIGLTVELNGVRRSDVDLRSCQQFHIPSGSFNHESITNASKPHQGYEHAACTSRAPEDSGTMFRALAAIGACVLAFSVVPHASADTIPIASGRASLYWDSSQTSFSLSSSDSSFIGEYNSSGLAGFGGGDAVDFSTTIPVTNAGNHPLPQRWARL
jgi:hypothetical protein